jgi:oxidoreductase
MLSYYFLQAPTANPKSLIFFSHSKGLTEEALVELGYKDTIMFRPMALSNTNRPVSRGFLENAFPYVTLRVLSVFNDSERSLAYSLGLATMCKLT